MKNKKRLVPWLIAAVIIAALAVIGKKLYDLMFGGSLAVTTEDLKNGIIACSPAIIFIVVVLIAALIVVVAAGKLKQPKRALVRAQAPIAILLAITLSVNWVILGVEYSVVNSVFAENVKVSDETMASGRAIADQIASEGIVLLKNDDKALPLSAGTKLNLFGWSSVRPLYGGTGSGDSDTSNAVSLIDGLKHAGFEVNEELVKFYENFRTERPVGTIRLREIGSKRGDFTVPEPTIAEYENANIFEDAVAYSDTAVVVVSRTGGEGFDIPQSITGPDEYNAQYGGLAQFYDFTTQAEDLDASKSYLELSNREIAMVDRVCKEFKNVIVVVNSSNAMELGWLDQYDSIKAAVLCGAPGELGFDSLGKILSGEVNPSGHLADTYVYDLLATPTANNFGGFAYDNYAEVTGSQDNRAMFVNYCEGIYVGYKFYETAAAEGLIDYDKVVQYPFGYGLSYTTFDSSIAAVEDDGEKITLDVAVKNTGDTAGKYVAEIFYEPPYYNGGIEKAAANLVQYAKTEILQPGEAQTLKITFRYEDMASYDSNGIKSANGAYVLEAGDYKINLCSDSHTILDTYVAKVDKDVIYDDFAFNDQDNYRQNNICTWLNEQSAREIYLKAFEQPIKAGGMGVMTSMNAVGPVWAGGCKALLTNILRDEWGFHGAVITDAVVSPWYMDGNLAIRTGGTKMLAFNITNEFYRDLNSVGTVTAMRNAAHGTLYALANSFAVTRAVAVPKWVKTTYAVDAVVAIILVAWEVCAICKYRKAKKEDEDTEQ